MRGRMPAKVGACKGDLGKRRLLLVVEILLLFPDPTCLMLMEIVVLSLR